MNEAIKMQISAFVDGELPHNEAELLLRRLCQDRALRQQASEYLAMGRIMRGERAVTGMATLRDRIFAELDDKVFEDAEPDHTSASSRFLRPMAGAAIAATVALAALLGLQRMGEVPDVDPATVEGTVVEAGYTVPEFDNDQLSEYFRWHHASSSTIGIGTPDFGWEFVTFPLPEGEDVVPEPDAADQTSDDEDVVEGEAR